MKLKASQKRPDKTTELGLSLILNCFLLVKTVPNFEIYFCLKAKVFSITNDNFLPNLEENTFFSCYVNFIIYKFHV